MNAQEKTFAFFDFDGTITTRDTLLPFLYYAFPVSKFYFNLLLLVPWGFAYLLKRVDNSQVKTACLTLFIKGMSLIDLEQKARNFALYRLDRYVRKEAMERFLWHRRQGHHLYLVSANLHIFLKYWGEAKGFEKVIATELQCTSSNEMTGKLRGKNCYGLEKVKRLKLHLKGTGEYYYAYGDSRGDKELLEMAHEGFFRKFQ